jgi:hypothetical protein
MYELGGLHILTIVLLNFQLGRDGENNISAAANSKRIEEMQQSIVELLNYCAILPSFLLFKMED